jgi:antitoxin ChpS
MTGPEGITETARAVLKLFADAVRRAYDDRLKGLVVFGSRARSDASSESDLDVAVILAGGVDLYGEKMALADLAYDAIVETGIHVQAWQVSMDEWQDPEKRSNPLLVQATRRDGLSVDDLGA